MLRTVPGWSLRLACARLSGRAGPSVFPVCTAPGATRSLRLTCVEAHFVSAPRVSVLPQFRVNAGDEACPAQAPRSGQFKGRGRPFRAVRNVLSEGLRPEQKRGISLLTSCWLPILPPPPAPAFGVGLSPGLRGGLQDEAPRSVDSIWWPDDPSLPSENRICSRAL